MPPLIFLNSTRWSYESDLNSPPARWSAEYLESGSSTHLPGETISRGPSIQVAIDVTVEGFTNRLLEGVVREWGFHETKDGVISRAHGIDLKALLLDFKPAAAVTFRGLELLSTSTAGLPTGAVGRITLDHDCAGNTIAAAYFLTFQQAVTQICSAAGLVATFDCYNYVLGHDVVWNTDQSANDVIAQLAQPFNVTERYKLDVFVQANNVVRIVERNRTAVPTVDIDYMQLIDRDVVESVLPPQWDVQVIGPTLTALEPDCAATDMPPGSTPPPGVIVIPPDESPAAYTRTIETEDREGYNAGDLSFGGQVLIARTTMTQYYDSFGRLTQVVKHKSYQVYVVRNPITGAGLQVNPKVRTEDSLSLFTYTGPQGQLTHMVESTFTTDYTDHYEYNVRTGLIEYKYVSRFAQVTALTETTTRYDDNGDVIHSLSSSYMGEPEKVPVGQILNIATYAQESRGIMKEHQLEEWFFWSGGQRLRQWQNRIFDRDTPGKVLKTSGHIEPATGVGRQESTVIVPIPTPATPTTPGGTLATRQRIVEIKAGPDTAHLRFPLQILGRTEDNEYFRQRIIAERASIRTEGTFMLLPDLNIREGYNVRVLNAPARWRTNTFYVVARSMLHNVQTLQMSLRGLAWL